MQTREFRVALVGRRLSDNENLGLGYLQAALAEAGLGVDRYTLNGATELAPIAEALLRGQADLVGLSLSDGGSAFLPLALGELLAKRGFSGHITAGGPFATLARDWLLGRYPWLESVVRFAGEAPLVALVSALRNGTALDQVAGLTTRQCDGRPAPVLDQPMNDRCPIRGERPRLLRKGVAHVMATRGCAGRCSYCGPAALQSQELEEGLRAGASRAELGAAGVGGVRRRPMDALCDEMATLWRGGTRYFYFVDEHVLPYQEPAALEFLRRLEEGLRRRKLGRFGIGCMLRSERLTARVVEEFARLGLVRAYLGVEFASAAEGRLYARRVVPEHNLEMLRCLAHSGVAVVTNLMLVHPQSTRESIQAGIDYLRQLPAGVFETTRMMIYHGTALFERMKQSDRLTGNPLRYGYTLNDPIAQRFSQLFARLRGEAFYDHSLAYRTHDAFLSLALARRLDPLHLRDDAPAELEALRIKVNRLYTDSLAEALALAEEGCEDREATQFVRRVALASDHLAAQLSRWSDRVSDALGTPRRGFSPTRAAAAGALSFALAGAACGGKADSDAEGSDRAGAAQGGAAGESTDSVGGHSEAQGGNPDSTGGRPIGQGGFSLGPGGNLPECTDSDLEQVKNAVVAALPPEAARCLYATFHLSTGPAGKLQVGYYTQYHAGTEWGDLLVDHCGDPPLSPLLTELDQAISDVSLPNCTTMWTSNVEHHGQVEGEMDRIAAAAGVCGVEVRIVLDDSGQVADVVGRGSSVPPETISCIQTALSGLTFPCLAGSQVCPEYICIE